MRLAVLLLCGVISGAASVFGQGNPDFPQTQGQSTYGGSGGDFGNSWQSDQPQTESNAPGSAPARSDPAPSGEDAAQRAPKKARKAGAKKGPNGGGDAGGQGGQDGQDGAEDKPGRGGDETAGNDGGGAPAPVDLVTARENFATLVESYVAKRSPKGYWPYAGKKGAKARRLTDPAVDEDSVRKVRGARFAARVKLKDAGARKAVALEFEADFSGTGWKIVAVRPAPAKSRR